MNRSLLRSVRPLLCALPLLAQPALAQTPWEKGPFECYVVPPLSAVKRLPDRLPDDGRLGAELRLVAAQGEFEPVSFVIAPRANVGRLELKATALAGPGGSEIPASAVDIKVVKTWYQAGTAWYSYFADPNRRELVPELLLNDETLVKVDGEKQENYLRVDGEYRWISYPNEKAEKAFNYLTEPVADSPALLPVALAKKENKQIWVTVKVPEKAAGGVYRGKINLVADGKPAGAMELQVRVLPFPLPMPKTYYNLENDYIVTLYGTDVLGLAQRLKIPEEEAEKQQKAIYRDLLDHNMFNCRLDADIRNMKSPEAEAARLKRTVGMLKEAGFVTKPLLTSGWSFPISGEEKNFDAFKERIGYLAKTLKEAAGHDDIYVTSWDEAGDQRVRTMREFTEYTNTQGLKLWVTTAEGRHFELAGYVIDFANHGGTPKREYADLWHSVGAKVASYAGPHTGPESPDVFRRWEGLARYKAFYDGSFNYEYFTQLHPTLYEKQKANVWNDFLGGHNFRRFNLVYPVKGGVIDTIAWEGFREGIDDVRYATKLKQEAARAIASGRPQAVHAAKKALMWLELLDGGTADLTAARQEMIEYILKIQEALQS